MNEYERIVQTIQAQGERMTIQRRLVIEALTATRAHMTINDVSDYIKDRHASQELTETTIYRILQKLKDLEIISQTDMSGAGVVYQVIEAARHHHLICLHCGKTIDVEDRLFDDLRENLLGQYGFHARIDHMAIYGTCADCAANEASA